MSGVRMSRLPSRWFAQLFPLLLLSNSALAATAEDDEFWSQAGFPELIRAAAPTTASATVPSNQHLLLHRPAGLEPDVAFWRKVFTEITTNEGYLHDDARLDIIYAVIPLPANHTPDQRRAIARSEGQKTAAILRTLASGKREGLSAEEQRVLNLWGADVDNATLAAAANRVRFQLGQADRFREGMVRSGRWADHIAAALAAAEVPPELIALPHVESAFNPAARSHVGAAGLWQFMPATGRRFMQIDNLVDERMDPYRASEAAGALLRRNYEITGTWPTAITAYNHGSNGMLRAIRDQDTDDIEVIVRNYRGRAFGFASRNFYVSFLAASDVRQQALAYFGELPMDGPDLSQVMVLPDYISLHDLSRALNIDSQKLLGLNPALRQPIRNGSKHIPKGYPMRLPPSTFAVDELLASIPQRHWQSAQIPDMYHVVQRGETLSSIAPRYGVPVNEIVGLNGLTSAHRIRVGQRLILPGAPEATSETVVEDGHYANEANEQPTAGNTSLSSQLAAVADAVAQRERQQLPPPDLRYYAVATDQSIRVQEGESLGLYANWLGISVQALRRHNGLTDGARIQVGQRIRLDLSRVNASQFENARIAHHLQVQQQYLAAHRINGTREHVVRQGESVWVLAERRYRVPVWLLRQYNPDLDLNAVQPGMRMVIPQVEALRGDA